MMVVEHLKILNKQNMLCTTLLRNELRTLEKEMVHAFKAFAKPKDFFAVSDNSEKVGVCWNP